MSNLKKITQHTRLTALLSEHVSVDGRIAYLETRREEIRDLIRMRLFRSLSCVGHHGKTSVSDVALELAEGFPHVREVLGFASFNLAPEWLLEGRA